MSDDAGFALLGLVLLAIMAVPFGALVVGVSIHLVREALRTTSETLRDGVTEEEDYYESHDHRIAVQDVYYRIGQLLFEKAVDYNEVLLTCASNDVKVGLTAIYGDGHDLLLQQKQADGNWTEILLKAYEDRDNAVRMAGLILAWADSDKIHEVPELKEEKSEA